MCPTSSEKTKKTTSTRRAVRSTRAKSRTPTTSRRTRTGGTTLFEWLSVDELMRPALPNLIDAVELSEAAEAGLIAEQPTPRR
jgi:hypothetical protein